MRMGTCMSNNCEGNDLIGKPVMKQECCCIDNHGTAGWIDNKKEVCERCPSKSKSPGEYLYYFCFVFCQKFLYRLIFTRIVLKWNCS